VVGTGYVGLSNAVLLAQKNELAAFDIDQKPVAMINDRLSPTEDDEIESFLVSKPLSLEATTDKNLAYKDAEFCSGSMIPDTNVGGNIATINEVSDDQKATFFFS